MDYKSEVKTPNLICLFCFIFKEALFFPPLPHQLGDGREAAGERECVCVRGGVGGLIKSPASRAAHEAVSSALDPFLTPRILRRRMRVGEVCCCGLRLRLRPRLYCPLGEILFHSTISIQQRPTKQNSSFTQLNP